MASLINDKQLCIRTVLLDWQLPSSSILKVAFATSGRRGFCRRLRSLRLHISHPSLTCPPAPHARPRPQPIRLAPLQQQIKQPSSLQRSPTKKNNFPAIQRSYAPFESIADVTRAQPGDIRMPPSIDSIDKQVNMDGQSFLSILFFGSRLQLPLQEERASSAHIAFSWCNRRFTPCARQNAC